MDPSCIYAFKNLSREDFYRKTALFLDAVKPDSQVIVFLSGHGDGSGAFVCSDGGALTPLETREFINSFANDTVLMIDACYSGRNEGFEGLGTARLPAFKENSIRIYSALGFLQSGLINYAENDFFKTTRQFCEDVLGMTNPITGLKTGCT